MEGRYKKYNLKKQITIGISEYCDIQILIGNIERLHVLINCEAGKINNYGSLETSARTKNSFSDFKLGEEIEFMGLKIWILPTFIMVNQVSTVLVHLPPYYHRKIKQLELKKMVNLEHAPRILKSYPTLSIKFKRINPIQEVQRIPLIFTVGPALMMSVASLISGGLSAYNGYLQGREIHEVIPMIILPIIMLSTTMIYHPLQRYYENKKKKEQKKIRIGKIQEYIAELDNQLLMYYQARLFCEEQRFFTVEQLSGLVSGKSAKIWFKSEEEDDFLVFGLGLGNKNSEIEYLNIPSDEDEYQDRISKWMKKNERIGPLWITTDLKEDPILSLVDENDKILNFLLLQIALFYKPNQIELLIVGNKNWINSHRFFYQIHHTRNENGEWNIGVTQQQVHRMIKRTERNNRIWIIQDRTLVSEEIIRKEKCILFCERQSNIPSFCKSFLHWKDGKLRFNTHQEEKEINLLNEVDCQSIFREITRIECPQFKYNNLSGKTFFDLYKVKKVEELEIKKRWSILREGCRVPIGFYENGDLFFLDLHEKTHGPHMIIGATTGAGKSEFLNTWILSMISNFSSDTLQFVIIDFKGGGLSETFKLSGKMIPHLAGTLTNLDSQDLERSLVSLKKECQNRQILFNKMKDKLHESSMNLDKYQSFWNEFLQLERISRLFIVVDEFAELKKENSDFIHELISIARIGRSLGIHLVLATQRPALAIDSEIWSNARSKICLRVQEKQDSYDLIQSDKAYYLKNPGEFYMKVDCHEEFAISAWSNARFTKETQEEIQMVDSQGVILKSSSRENEGITQLVAVLREIQFLSKNKTHQYLWLPKIEKITLSNDTPPGVVFGKIDNYYQKEQPWFTHLWEKESHGLVISLNMKEKEKMIRSLVYGLHYEEEIEYYFHDTLNNFSYMREDKSCIYGTGSEIFDWEDKIQDAIEQNNGKTKIIIITHYPKFIEENNHLLYKFGSWLRDGPMNQIYFFIFSTTFSTIPYRWTPYFQRRYCLETKQKSEISSIFEQSTTMTKVGEDFGLIKMENILPFRLLNINKEELLLKIRERNHENDTDFCKMCSD